MAAIDQAFTGSQGLVYYGSTLIFVDTWSVNIAIDTIDITTIDIYKLPVPLPKKIGTPLDPYSADQLPNNLEQSQAQYGAARVNIGGGLRVANIVCSGLCAVSDIETNYMPRINNEVYLQFSNSTQPDKTLFNFPVCIVKNVSFEFSVRNYQRWTMNCITNGEFDIFPGKTV